MMPLVRDNCRVILDCWEQGYRIVSILDDQMVIMKAVGWMIAKKLLGVKYSAIVCLGYKFIPALVVSFCELLDFHANFQYSKRI